MSATQTPANNDPPVEGKLWTSFVTVNADSMKFFASGGVAWVFLLGFSYSRSYLQSFGLSLPELDLSYVETTAHGAYLLQDGWVLGASLSIVFVASLIVSAARRRFGSSGSFALGASLFLLACYMAVWIGACKAKEHSAIVTSGTGGYPAYCKLSDKANFPQNFKKNFEKITVEHNVRKIWETKDAIYLTFVLDPPWEGFPGQSIGFNKTDIVYCRIIGQ